MNLKNYYEFIFLRNISVFRDLNLGDLFTIIYIVYIQLICTYVSKTSYYWSVSIGL